MITPILSSQVEKHGSESKAVPKDDRTANVTGAAVLGSRQGHPWPVSLLPCRHTSQQNLEKPKSLALPGSTTIPRTQEVSDNTDLLQSTTDVLLFPRPCFSDPAFPQPIRVCQTGSQGLPGTGTTFHGGSYAYCHFGRY